jgi:ABC-type molybdate transport system substrate-binding protein
MSMRTIVFVFILLATLDRSLAADLVSFVQQPQPVTVLQGQPATFSVVVTGTPPFMYRWIRGGIPYVTSSVPTLTLTNNQTNVSVRVAVTNIATGPGGINSSTVQLTVVPDADGDGIPDPWELLYGLVPSDPADAPLDFDLDGMSNLDEYRAGTDPNNAKSLLKLVVTPTNSAVLQFVAQTNKSYTVQYRSDLTSTAWINLTSINAQAFVSTVQVNVPKPPPEPSRFYRIVTPLVP